MGRRSAKIEKMFKSEHFTPQELESFKRTREIKSRLNPGTIYRMSQEGLTITETR